MFTTIGIDWGNHNVYSDDVGVCDCCGGVCDSEYGMAVCRSNCSGEYPVCPDCGTDVEYTTSRQGVKRNCGCGSILVEDC